MPFFSHVFLCWVSIFPGLAVSILIAATAQFLSEHYGAPAMLLALLLGMALNFLAEDGTRTAPGIAVTSRNVLRFGVVLLGARTSGAMLAQLGWPLILLIVSGVIITVLFGILAARIAGQRWQFALLTGSSVAICGASAAMAVAAVLPKHQQSERDLIFTVLAVTLLSTIAMVFYPMLSGWLELNQSAAGVFIGGTIHDVAQVVGASFSISPEVGETATLVKLIRVSMLAPVVLAISIAIHLLGLRDNPDGRSRTALLPSFAVGFFVLAALNTAGLIPVPIVEAATLLSRWCLMIAIAAVGVKTSLKKMLEMGRGAIALIVADTVFLGGWVLAGLHLLG